MSQTPKHPDPRAVVDRLVEAMLKNDPVAAAAVYSEDVVIVDPLFDVVGREAAVTAFAAWFDAFRITSLEVAESVVEDSRIASPPAPFCSGCCGPRSCANSSCRGLGSRPTAPTRSRPASFATARVC